MDHLMFIDRIARKEPQAPEIRYMVSGSDDAVRRAVLDGVIRKCRDRKQPLVVISDSGRSEDQDLGAVRAGGYRIENGMSGTYFLYDPFRKLNAVDGLSRVRQILDILEYDEKQKGKLTSYLNFIRHLEQMETGKPGAGLSLEQIGAWCTAMIVEEKLQKLVEERKISESQRMMYLAKYAECASAGADFEDMIFLMAPFMPDGGRMLGDDADAAVLFPTGALDEDAHMRDLILKLLQFGLKERQDANIAVLVMDRGYGSRTGIANLLTGLPANTEVHLFSSDVFTLCDAGTLSMILNRFPARVYSRHTAMSSALAIEQACGDLDVVKKTYNVTYDRRWRANSPWDILMGNNKTENYGQLAPVREPRYRKEMIVQLAPGTGIVEYMGASTVFSI